MKPITLIKAGSSIAVALGAAFLLLRAGKPVLGEQSFYYDLSESRMYVQRANLSLPHAGVGGAGNDGVVAIVYTCGDLRDRSARQIAYLQTFTPELAQKYRERDEALERHEPGPPEVEDRVYISANTLVRRVDEATWHPMSSPEGLEIMAILSRSCPDGSYPKVCSPTD